MLRPAPILLLAVLVAIFALPPESRSQSPNQSGNARKIDEFGDIQLSEKKARLDNFVIQLQQEPTAKGFVIVYRSRRDQPGFSVRLLDQMRRYLLYNRGLTSDQIVTIDGGPAVNLVQEFWIVPPGTTPEIRSDAYTTVIEDRTATRKYDEYFFDLGETVMDGGEIMGDSLPGYAEALHREPASLGYVIAYPQCRRNGRQTVCDRRGSATRMLQGVRAELTKTHNVPLSRLRSINGGYRRSRAVELWIVPRGEHPPIATPNAYPRRPSSPQNQSHGIRSPEPISVRLPHARSNAQIAASTGQLISPDEPRKFDEFGDILPTYKKARLDKYVVELQRATDSKGVVIVYRSSRDLPGLNVRLLRFFQHYLMDVRGFSSDRITFIDGEDKGWENRVSQELWVIPNGTDPRAVLSKKEPWVPDRGYTRKYDEYYFSVPGDYEYEEGEGESLPEFAEAVRKEANAVAYVTVYGQYYVDHNPYVVHLDRTARVTKIVSTIQRDLVRKHGLPRSRVRVVNGGYRRSREVELWIVPPGEHPPIATPNAFPRRKSRR